MLLGACVGENARVAFPGCVELIHLQVREHQRGRGVGTAIIAAAEQIARDAGKKQIALGVDLTNEAAARLYRRLNYQTTGVIDATAYHWLDEHGTPHHERETSELLVKQL